MSYCTYRGELELKCVATATADEKNYNGELVCVGRTRDNTTCKPKAQAMADQMTCYPGKTPEQIYPGKFPVTPGKGESQYGWSGASPSGYDNYPYGIYNDPSRRGAYGGPAGARGTQSYPAGAGPYSGGPGPRGQMGPGFNSSSTSPYRGGPGGPCDTTGGKMGPSNPRNPGYNNFSYTSRW